MTRAPAGPATRTSELVARLREDLLAGELKPGAPLRLAMVRERYGAGLTPLREALFQLVAEGLVTTEDQRGFRVAEVSRLASHSPMPSQAISTTVRRVCEPNSGLRIALRVGWS